MSPLEGVRIVECASFVAGPSACLALGQLGADVIKVDPLGGAADQHRWPLAPSGRSLYWTALNKGKRSLAVDLRSDEGKELVTALITAPGPESGVLVNNSVGRRWLAHEVLTARRPDLIHLRVQGHPDGRPAVDYTVNAEVGVPGITGDEQGAAPVNHVLPAWDLITGMTAATGVLAALRERAATGRGSCVELALADVATAGVANLGWLAEAELRGGDRPRHGNHVYGSFGVDFETADHQRVMVVALTGGQWTALQEATGTTDVFAALAEPLGADLGQEADRYRLRETIAAILRPWFAARTLAQVRERFDAGRVLWSRYRGMADVVAEHRASATETVLTSVDQPEIGPSVAARSPLRWDGEYDDASPAPRLGEHTDDVLTEVLGLSPAELGGLHDRGVIAGTG
ncbi:2-methylfumaryl-CoA isomerase [Saccharopolyspora gloriosae]|uniref:2-methylfumaryl-CoA isomerase n=1 Tax=Saccharopolyspora gloriosae TaxID=455344 RepID=A0A840NL91_9PSEU|nr:CoA transferase [Saccharopolyspora gloriosae]MBB5070893.1 2-methylfumaryl-CoA isomerase [Saccharopolyspora gloriosae]